MYYNIDLTKPTPWESIVKLTGSAMESTLCILLIFLVAAILQLVCLVYLQRWFSKVYTYSDAYILGTNTVWAMTSVWSAQRKAESDQVKMV